MCACLCVLVCMCERAWPTVVEHSRGGLGITFVEDVFLVDRVLNVVQKSLHTGLLDLPGQFGGFACLPLIMVECNQTDVRARLCSYVRVYVNVIALGRL